MDGKIIMSLRTELVCRGNTEIDPEFFTGSKMIGGRAVQSKGIFTRYRIKPQGAVVRLNDLNGMIIALFRGHVRPVDNDLFRCACCIVAGQLVTRKYSRSRFIDDIFAVGQIGFQSHVRIVVRIGNGYFSPDGQPVILLKHIAVVFAVTGRLMVAVIHAFFLDVNLSATDFGAIVRAFYRDVHFLRHGSAGAVGYPDVKIQWKLFTLRQIVGLAVIIQDKLVIVGDRTVPVIRWNNCQGTVIGHQRDDARIRIGKRPFHRIAVFIR